MSLDAGMRGQRNPAHPMKADGPAMHACQHLSCAPGGPRGEPSPGTRSLEVLTHYIRVVFPLGKDQTLALYKTSKMSHKEMSWHSGVICGNQGFSEASDRQMDAVTVSRAAREGWRESCAHNP